jgi:MiaB-like tRNA modifying enzyme
MRVFIETYGCAANQADSETIAGILFSHGHDILKEGDGADVHVINTCTVKFPTEQKIRRRLASLSSKKCRVVVCGCMPAAQKNLVDEYPAFSFIGVNSGDIAAAISAVVSGVKYVNIAEPGGKNALPSIRGNPVVEILPVSEGCVGGCTYCITKLARGGLVSYRPGDIVKRVEGAVSEGVKEVWLTSQDTGAYGLDFGVRLPELINDVAAVPGDFMVRVGMMNPDHALSCLDDLVSAFAGKKVYKFAHIPVQSGDDKVLSDMMRRYTVKDFIEVVSEFRRKLDATISTDVICGYPTESEEAFERTLDLLRETKPDVLNISRFGRRPGTAAAKLKELPGRTTKNRSRRANKLFEKIGLERNRKWVGWRGRALASERNGDGTLTLRNAHYKPIIVKAKDDAFGRWLEVEVEEATHYDLRAKIVTPI